MGSSDLSTDLTLGVLTPASEVREVEGQSANQDAQGKARRRLRPEDEKQEEESLTTGTGDPPAHQLDHLA